MAWLLNPMGFGPQLLELLHALVGWLLDRLLGLRLKLAFKLAAGVALVEEFINDKNSLRPTLENRQRQHQHQQQTPWAAQKLWWTWAWPGHGRWASSSR